MKKMLGMIVIIVTALTGCWDYIESEDLGVIRLMGVGLDKDNNIRVLVQEVPHEKPSANGKTTGGNSAPFHLYAETGVTISEAVQKMSGNEHHRLYLAHMEVIVLDEDLVRSKGLEPIIDFFARNPRMRPAAWMLVSPRGQLDKIFSTDVGINIDTGEILDESIYNNKVNPYRTVNKTSDVIDLLYTTGDEAYTSGVIVDPGSSAIETGHGKIPPTQKFFLRDTAVFKGDKMVGWLKDEEHRGLSWINEHVKGGFVTIPFDDRAVSLRITNVKSKIIPIIKNEQLKIEINIKLSLTLAESQANYNFLNEEVIERIQGVQNARVKKEIAAALKKSRNLESDFLGFGNYFNMTYPQFWKDVQNNWYSYFKDVEVTTNVNSTVQGIGNNYKPLR